MASGSGSWSPTTGSGNRGRLTWDITQSPSSVGSGTSSVSLRLRVWYESRYSISDSSNTYTISGAWTGSGSRSINHGGSGGRTLLYDGTITVSTSYAGTVSRSFSASFTGINATPNIPSVSGSHTVAKRPNRAPNPPTWGSTTRVGTDKCTITWSNNPTTAGPITRNEVQYWSSVNQNWRVNSNNVSATATSYTAQGLATNREYRYRVRAVGPGGASAWVTGGTIATPPSAPVNVSAQKLSGGAIRVSGTDTAGPTNRARTFLIYDSPDGGAETLVGTAGSLPWTFVDPDPSVTHSFRIRTRINSQGEMLSPFSGRSNTVQLLAPPNAPTPVSPTGVWDRDAQVEYKWVHNPVDTSEQEGRQIQRRWQGDTEWLTVTYTASDQESFTPVSPYGESGVLEWRVRTRGAHPEYGPYSPVVPVIMAARPTAAINSPAGGTLDQSQVTLTIGYDNPDGSPQSRVQAELIHDGEVVETLSWTGTGDSRPFRTSLDDTTEYTVRARVQAGNGLWSDWVEVWFVTSFPSPVPFVVDAVWDRETGAVTLSGAPDSGGVAEYMWDEFPHYSTSTRTTTENTFVNEFENPNFAGGVGLVTVWENLLPAPRPSKSATRYSLTGASGVGIGDDYREIEITTDASGTTTIYRTGALSGHELVAPGDVYTGRLGVGNPNAYPVTLRAGFLRTTTTAVTFEPTRTSDITIHPGGYEEIVVGPFEIDDTWSTVRLGVVAPSTGSVPAGSRLYMYDGFTVTRGTECPYLIHGDLGLGEAGADLVGDWYSAVDGSASRLAAPRVYGAATTGDARAIRVTDWGQQGTALRVLPGGDTIGLSELGNFPSRVRELGLEEGPDYEIENRIGTVLPKLMITCFHGGDFEQGALEMSDAVAEALGSTWWGIDAHVRPEKVPGSSSPSWDALHLSSNNYGHQGLLDMLAECNYAVSFHGSTDWNEDISSPGAGPGVPFSFIGGTNERFKESLADQLRVAGFLCDTDVENFPAFPGTNPNNVVHQTRSGSGVQIELSNAQRRAFFVGGDLSRPNRGNTTQTFADYVNAIVAGVQNYLEGL